MTNNQLVNILDRAVHDKTKVLTIIVENKEQVKDMAEDFLNGFYYEANVELLKNGIRVTF